MRLKAQERVLSIESEEAMCLESELPAGDTSVTVQVCVSFRDVEGYRWSATRNVRVKLRKEK